MGSLAVAAAAHDDPSQATRDWIDVKIASLRSEMRLLFVVSVAGNQLLSHVAVSSTVAALASGATIVGAVMVKAALFAGAR